MDENVALVHGPRELHALGIDRDLHGQPSPEHGGETLRRRMEGAFGVSLRFKPDRRRDPNGFAGPERRRRS